MSWSTRVEWWPVGRGPGPIAVTELPGAASLPEAIETLAGFAAAHDLRLSDNLGTYKRQSWDLWTQDGILIGSVRLSTVTVSVP